MSAAERHLREYSEMDGRIMALVFACGAMCAAETKDALLEALRICRAERVKVERAMAQESSKAQPEEIAW